MTSFSSATSTAAACSTLDQIPA